MKSYKNITAMVSASAAIAISLSMTSCQTPGESALLGGGLGAATGAIIGNQSGDAAKGALIGGAAGAGGGYLIGKEKQRQNRTNYPAPRYDPRYSQPSQVAPYY